MSMSILDRRAFIKVSAATLAFSSISSVLAQQPDKRPNILFLFTDDQAPDTIRALGNPLIKTPNLDRLVKQGTAFTNAYIMGGSSPAVCSPSRAALFSGRTLWNLENQGLYGYEISERYPTLPQVFRESGYTTFGTGKNEPGRLGHFNRSFSHGDKILFKGMSNQYNLQLHDYREDGDYNRQNRVTHRGKQSAEVYADATIEFLEEHGNKNEPWLAYVSFQTPHDPKQCPEEYLAMYKPEDMPLPKSYKPEHPFDNGMLRIRDEKLAKFPRTEEAIKKHLAEYYAMVTHTDAQIGRILDKLEASGERDNTIIVFASDNGLAIGRHGLMGKQNVYEHSVKVPFIIAGPGIPQGEKRDQLCYIYDIYPTLCEMVGVKTPDTVQYQSMMPMINNADAPHRDYLSFGFMNWQRSVRDKQYKLIEYCVKGKRHTQLFDLTQDPEETKNLAGDPAYAGTVQRLRKLLEEERIRLNDGNTPYQATNLQGKEFWETYHATDETTYPE